MNHNASDYEYVDPQKCYDTGCAELLWPASLNLYQYPETNGAAGKRVYLEGASAVAVSKDGKTYTFTIRTGQKASNGKTVTPQWFVHAFERVAEPEDGRRSVGSFGRRLHPRPDRRRCAGVLRRQGQQDHRTDR